MNKIRVDKNVKIPDSASGTRKGECKFPFKRMKIGDSFAIDIKRKYLKNIKQQQSSILTNARTYCNYHRLDWKFTSRQMNNTIRIWRIK